MFSIGILKWVIGMAIDYVMIGRRIKGSRLEAKLTQERVAEAAGITTVYLSKIENGKVTPTLDTLGEICTAIGADLGYVVAGSQYNQKTYGNEAVVALFRACCPEVKPIALRILKELSELKNSAT